MDIRQLKALQAIADSGNFGEAAATLGLTQSALSHQIRQLEEELGETLLIRARPQSYPSTAGRVVLESFARISAEFAALEKRFASAKHGAQSGILRIAATPMSFTYLLGDLCEVFRQRFPAIELVFTATESAELAVRRVLTGASDVAFGPLTGQHESLSEVRLARAEHAFIVRAGHPLASHNRVTPDQLRQYSIALFQPKSGTRSLTDAIFEGKGYPPVLTESNDAQFLKRMVSISDASALMVAYALDTGGQSRSPITCLRLDGPPVVVNVGLIHKTNLHMNALEVFKGLCLDLRGPKPLELMLDRPNGSPFLSSTSSFVSPQGSTR
jgi:DNA-binding transcriptional LysR family regulator